VETARRFFVVARLAWSGIIETKNPVDENVLYPPKPWNADGGQFLSGPGLIGWRRRTSGCAAFRSSAVPRLS
jgi:hypothetical protein